MSQKENEPIIVSAVRTPIGDFGGSIRSVLHEHLAVTVLKAVSERVNFPKDQLDDVYWGVVMLRSDENGLARGAVLKAGIPVRIKTNLPIPVRCAPRKPWKRDIVNVNGGGIALGHPMGPFALMDMADFEWPLQSGKS